MSTALSLILTVIALLSLSASAQEVAYAYGDLGGRLLENGNITPYNGTDIVTFSVAASPKDPSTTHVTGRSIDSIKDEINLKINRGNYLVRNQGLTLVGNRSGPRKIDQICAIYDVLVDKKNWTYVDDWKGLEQFQHSNYTLIKGQEVGGLGKGDCDDFAILLAALIESIGGTSRLILASGPQGAHIYAEVYLGKLNDSNGDVEQMIGWLRARYNADEINIHIDLTTGDVWLNMDWCIEETRSDHPGGPFINATSHLSIPIRELSEEPFIKLEYTPQAAAGAIIEMAYSHGISGNRVLDNGNITIFNASDKVFFAVDAGPGSSLSIEANRSLDSINKEISQKINKGNEPVSNEGRRLIGNISGPRRIDQVCAIYDFLVDERNWTYVSDWKNLEQFQYSNNSLKMGQVVGGLGKGDCDDFAILLSALVESMGATPRIVFAHGPAGSHAYTEVYLGKANGSGRDVDRMVRWLRYKYNVNDIKVHTDLANGDVWLNLDWWKDPNTGEEMARHPGGPFYMATKHVIVYPTDNIGVEPLTPADVPPIAIFSVTPLEPALSSNATFDASSSYDIDGNITSYQWDFGDGTFGEGKIIIHSYSMAGPVRANLTVIDDHGLKGFNSTIIQVNHPPVARFTKEPENPMLNEPIRFDASSSYDLDEDTLSYLWEFGDGDTGRGASKHHTFNESRIFDVKLTVNDNRGAKNATSIPIPVSGAKIANVKRDDSISQFFDLRGDYSLFDCNKYKSIWVFVRPEGANSRYNPQSIDSCHPSNASRLNGRWENRITVGGPNDSGRYFELVTTLVNEEADREIRRLMLEWCSENLPDGGFPRLPDGVHETDLIRIKRSADKWSSSQDISSVSLPGTVEITSPDSDETSVDGRTTVRGNRSRDAEYIWVLVHNIRNGRWYPQSMDNEINSGHVTNVLPLEWAPDWYIDAFLNGIDGDPFELVAVLANSSADEFFNRFQMSCARAVNPDGTKGNYTGLLTIELPPGIDEQDRMRVQRLPEAVKNNISRPHPDGPDDTILDKTDLYDNNSINNSQNLNEIAKNEANCITIERFKLPHEGVVNSVAFNPDGSKVLTGSGDGTACIWNVSSGQKVHTLPHEGVVNSVAFSPDGSKALTGSGDGTACIWNVSSGQKLQKLPHDVPVAAVAFSPDGSKVLTGCYDDTACIWDASSGNELPTLHFEGVVLAVAFSPDGSKAMMGSNDGIAQIWNTSSHKDLFTLRHKDRVLSVAFSPDSSKALTGSYDNTACIWNVSSGQKLRTLPHEGIVNSVAFSPDGSKALTGSNDGTARIWDVSSGQKLRTLPHEDGVLAVAFSPVGSRVLTGSADCIARIWDT